VIALYSGLEEQTGLTGFLDRIKEMNARLRDSRAGSQYPAGLPLDEKSCRSIVDNSLAWFRDWIYEAFSKNLISPLNRQLYQLLVSLHLRRERLANGIRQIAGNVQLSHPVRLAGCYFAATGADESRRAFTHDVIQRLIMLQSDVAWMPEWRARDQRRMWLAMMLAIMTLAIVAVDAFLFWQILNRWQGGGG